MAEEAATEAGSDEQGNLFGSAPGGNVAEAEAPETALPAFDPESWRTFVPEEVAAHPALKDVQGYEDLVKGYVAKADEAQTMVKVPDKDAKPKEWADFYTKLGRPKTLEGYNEALKAEGFEWAEGTDELQQAVFEQGLSSGQIAAISKVLGKMGAAQAASAEQTHDNLILELQKEWGRNFDQRFGLANAAAKKFQTEGVADMIKATGIGQNPVFVKMMAEIGQHWADEGMIDGSSLGVMSKASAAKEAERVTALPAYMDASHPEHKQVVEEATRLFNIAYAGEPVAT